MLETTYLTTDALSARIKSDVRTIRERLEDSVLLEGWPSEPLELPVAPAVR